MDGSESVVITGQFPEVKTLLNHLLKQTSPGLLDPQRVKASGGGVEKLF